MTAELEPDGLYHLATPAEWAAAEAAAEIAPPSLVTEGFVHCSWGRQVPGTVDRHFGGVTDLLALHLEPEHLGDAAMVEEDSYGSGATFPHVYGVIPVAAVTGVVVVRGAE